MSSYPFNPLASAGPNNINGEVQALAPTSGTHYNYLFALNGPFFLDTLSVTCTPVSQTLGKLTLNSAQPLVLGVDYVPAFEFIDATNNCGRAVFGGISFIDPRLVGSVTLNYITLGGVYVQTGLAQQAVFAAQTLNPRTTSFEHAFNITSVFPPVTLPYNEIAHTLLLDALQNPINAITSTLTAGTALVGPLNFESHITNYNNPHGDTAATFGLAQVPNWAVATPTEAQTGTATNLFVTPAGAVQALTNPIVVGAASPTAFGVAKLNLGGQGGDSTDTQKALTTAGLLTMRGAAGSNAIKSLFSYERQILTFAKPIAYPVHCLGSLCANFRDLVHAVETSLNFAPIQANAALGCIYLPYDMTTPDITLS